MLFAYLVLASSLTAPSPPASEPDDTARAFAVSWDAPKPCPSREQAIAAVDTLLGDLEPRETRVRADVTIERRAKRFELELKLTTKSGTGTRSLSGETCEEVVDAAALIVAIAVNPKVLERAAAEAATEGRATSEDAEESETEAKAKPDADDEPPPPPPKKPKLRVAVSVAGGLGAFILPAPTAALQVGVGLTGSRWRVDVIGSYWTPQTQSASATVSGRFQLGYAGVRGCGVPSAGPVEFPICGGFDVGAMRGEGLGEGLQTTRAKNAVWLAARAGPSLLWRATDWLGLLLQADGVLPLLRPVFDTQPSGTEVFRAGPAGLKLLLGLEFRPG